MVETGDISEEARAIMRSNALATGSLRGGRYAQPAMNVTAVGAAQRPSFFSRLRQTVAVWMAGVPADAATGAGSSTPPRAWDYPIFYNYSLQPDAAKAMDSGVSMYQLKMLAQQTHVALARERAKNKQKKKRWSFGLERQPGESAHEAHRRAVDDPRIRAITDFFRMPDGENELPEWIGLNLENIFTLGVTAVVPWRKVSGDVFRLEVYDSATIIPKLDAGGRRPMGIDPDTGEKAVAFQQYIKGVPFSNFTDDDLLWYGPNPVPAKVYPVGPTELLLLYVNIALRRDVQRLSHYTAGNIPAGLMPMPQEWTPQQIKDWYDGFNLFIVNLPENMAKVVPIPYAGAGAQPIFPQLEGLKDQWEESWQRLVFGFFDVPVSTMVRELTKGNADSNRGQADEEGEQYYEDVCRRLINRCVAKWFGWTDVVARTESEVETDLLKQSQIDAARVKLGLDQPNEVRERDGKEPIRSLIGREVYQDSTGNYVDFGVGYGDGEDPAGIPANDGQEPVEHNEPVAKAIKKNSHSAGLASSRRMRVY